MKGAEIWELKSKNPHTTKTRIIFQDDQGLWRCWYAYAFSSQFKESCFAQLGAKKKKDLYAKMRDYDRHRIFTPGGGPELIGEVLP